MRGNLIINKHQIVCGSVAANHFLRFHSNSHKQHHPNNNNNKKTTITKLMNIINILIEELFFGYSQIRQPPSIFFLCTTQIASSQFTNITYLQFFFINCLVIFRIDSLFLFFLQMLFKCFWVKLFGNHVGVIETLLSLGVFKI